MSTAPATGPIDVSYVSELLEVALSILERHHDRDLARKTLALRDVLETSRKRVDLDCRETLSKALADLTGAVQDHLDIELAAVVELWTPHITSALTERRAAQR